MVCPPHSPDAKPSAFITAARVARSEVTGKGCSEPDIMI
jgi:hypothetical protein